MKGLILKDLYNIGHYVRYMILLFAVFSFIFIASGNISGYIFFSVVMCSMLIVTTFAFDDSSKWAKYAMIMPISKKELVIGKYIVLILFCFIGALVGLAGGTIGGIITNTLTPDISGIKEILATTFTAFAAALVFGSISIPLVFKFGAEKGRILLLIAFLIPAGICYAIIYSLLFLTDVGTTEGAAFILLRCSPLLVLAWCYVMYRISYGIFRKQEL